MTFDPTKPVQTRDGLSAEILCTDLKANLPIVARVKEQDGYESIRYYTRQGKQNFAEFDGPCDLINVPETKSWWFNVYEDCVGTNKTRERAEYVKCDGRLALLEIRMCEGKHVETIQHEVEK